MAAPADKSQAAPVIADPNLTAAAAAPSESWANGWLKPDGSFDHSRFDHAPDDLKPLRKEFERYKSADDFIKGSHEREALLGKKGIFDPLPAGATPEQKAERAAQIRRATGAPDKPDGYGIKRPDGLPETAWNQGYADAVAKIMFEEGGSPQLAQRLLAENVRVTNEAQAAWAAQQAASEKAQDDLARQVAQKEGIPFDKVMELAAKAGQRWGLSMENPVMKNASALLAMARVGQAMGESTLVTGDANFGSVSRMTAAEAEKESTAIMTNKDHPLYAAFWNRDKKISEEEHQKAVARRDTLSRIAYADRKGRR